MGFGYSAVCTWRASDELMNETVGEELALLKILLNAHDLDMEDFYRACEDEDADPVSRDVTDQMVAIYERLREKFKAKTRLEVFINYHDCQRDGSRYDDVDGVFWELDGCEKLTPAARRLGRKIFRASYVVGG